MSGASAIVAKGASWLHEARENAWRTFSSLGGPAGDVETWRRMPFDNWRMGALSRGDAYEISGVDAGAAEAVAKAGGALLSLEAAAESHPEALKAFLAAPAASKDFLKFETANLALWRGGVFLHVPKGVRLEEPVRITYRHDSSRPFSFPRAVILVDEGADVSIVEEHVSDGRAAAGAPPVSAAFSNVLVGRGARLRFFSSQELSRDSVHFSHQRVVLGRDASLEHCSVLLGGRRHKSELQVVLGGENAQSEIKGVLLARADQFFDPHTFQHHTASRTRSNLLFRAAVKDESRSIYTGLLRIERDALGCEAYQTNKNLLISETARADSTPILEILPSEVACRHGATAGPIDPEELYYLACRGIPEKEAMRMLVLGFFDPILAAFPIEALREHLAEKVERGALP